MKQDKPIIATTLSGLFVRSDPWKRAHTIWFQKAADELNDPFILKWVEKKDYFAGVDEVMRRRFSKLSDSERTSKARELFFDSVCEYISRHPESRNDSMIDYFRAIKTEFTIALITTNTKSAIDRLTKLLHIEDLFDFIEFSLPEEKDDKIVVFERFIKKHGKPVLYIGGDRKDSFNYCSKEGISALYADLEKGAPIEGVKTVNSLSELRKQIHELPVQIKEDFNSDDLPFLIKRGMFLVNSLAIVYNPKSKKVLIGRRENDPLIKQLTWCFPGGRPAHGKPLEDSLLLEIKNKTSLTKVNIKRLFFARVLKEKDEFLLLYYLCNTNQSKAIAGEKFVEVKWIKPKDCKKYFTTSLDSKVNQHLLTLK